MDDHAILRIGLTALLRQANNFIVCGAAENAEIGLQMIAKTSPALAIFDISLKGGVDGIELTKLVMKAHPTLRVLVLSLHD